MREIIGKSHPFGGVPARILAVGAAMLVLSGCGNLMHSYQSLEAQRENGRRMLEEALKESDVITLRLENGWAEVETDIVFDEDSYCALTLSERGTGRYEEYWSSDVVGGFPPSRSCGRAYGRIESVRAKDMRDCRGAECLWLKGF